MPKKTKSIKEVLDSKNPFVRDVWADYADGKFVPKYQVYRFDDKADNRFYFFRINGEIVIASGITEPFGRVSIDREGIEKWKENTPNWRQELNASGEYGTLEHILFGGISLGNGVNSTVLAEMKKLAIDNNKSSDMPAKDVLAYLKFQEDYKLRPLLVEAQLAWQCPRTKEWLAMTIDMLAEIEVTDIVKEMVEDGVWQRGDKKGEPKMVEKKTEVKKTIIALIDFKSNFFEKEKRSFYETHLMQLLGGSLAVEQNFDIKVDKIYNFSCKNWRTEPSYVLYEHKPTEKDWQSFDGYWLTITSHDLNKPSGGFLITDKFKSSSDYKILSYKEYIENILPNENK